MSAYQSGTDLWLWLDPSQACNIACALCYTRESHARSFLSEDALSQVIANLRTVPNLCIREITFNWRGEPLMNKRFPELLRMVCDGFPGTRVQFHTNAMLINRDVASRLIAVGREYFVYLSIDGGNQRAHDANRGAGTFGKALRGGHRLLDVRGANSRPHITLYQLDMGEDESDYAPEFLALAARADQWQRVDPIVRSGADASTFQRTGVSPSDWWEAESHGAAPTGPCFWAGYSLSVAPDGTASICILSQSSQSTGRIGNLLNETAAQVLERASAFRADLERRGRAQIAHCRQCRKIEGVPRPPRAGDDLKLRGGPDVAN
jgi:sulfatase maturation enzyme AslB (radical SAM superfamily)